MLLGAISVEFFRFSVAIWGWGAVLVYGFFVCLLFIFFWLLLR